MFACIELLCPRSEFGLSLCLQGLPVRLAAGESLFLLVLCFLVAIELLGSPLDLFLGIELGSFPFLLFLREGLKVNTQFSRFLGNNAGLPFRFDSPLLDLSS